jgi:hypothetical protein
MFNKKGIIIGGVRIAAAGTPLVLPCHWPGISSCPSTTAGWIGGRAPRSADGEQP